jgi:hypothetical protein
MLSENNRGPTNIRYFPTVHVRYSIILKNACSTIQATLLESEGINGKALILSGVHSEATKFPDQADTDAVLFTVVRDPFTRFVSTFLDRIVVSDFPETCLSVSTLPLLPLVRPDLSLLYNQGLESSAAGNYGPVKKRIIQSLTLSDVAKMVAITPDTQIEAHFKSQQWFLAGRHHDVIFSMENLGWQGQVEQLIGRPLVSKREHATAHLTSAPGQTPNASKLAVSELREVLNRSGSLPAASDFLTHEVRALIASRYKKDVELVASLTIS